MKTIRHQSGTLPKVSQKELDEIKLMKDTDIDFSDIQPLTDDFWNNAKRVEMYKPIKKQITIKIDADVLDWLKSGGKGYQTRMNAILRQSMLSSI